MHIDQQTAINRVIFVCSYIGLYILEGLNVISHHQKQDQ